MKKKLDTKFSLALGLGIIAFVLGVGVLALKANAWIASSFVILGIILLILAIYLYKQQGKKHEIDYYQFLTMGIVFFIIGMTTENPGMWGFGLLFMIMGLANKEKWKKRRKWSELTKREKNIKLVVIGILFALLLAGIVVFLLVNKGFI